MLPRAASGALNRKHTAGRVCVCVYVCVYIYIWSTIYAMPCGLEAPARKTRRTTANVRRRKRRRACQKCRFASKCTGRGRPHPDAPGDLFALALEELVELRRAQLLPTLRPEPEPQGRLQAALCWAHWRTVAPQPLFLSLRSWQETAPGRLVGLVRECWQQMPAAARAVSGEFGSHALGLRPPLGAAPWGPEQPRKTKPLVLARRSPWSRRAAPCSPGPWQSAKEVHLMKRSPS